MNEQEGRLQFCPFLPSYRSGVADEASQLGTGNRKHRATY